MAGSFPSTGIVCCFWVLVCTGGMVWYEFVQQSFLDCHVSNPKHLPLAQYMLAQRLFSSS